MSQKIRNRKKGSVSDHTAIPNWSGYIYQGLCAAYVALRLCLEDEPKAGKYFLSLDSYEDFAILDETKKIVSLHQCKCFAQNPGQKFREEFKKMKKRKADYVARGECDPDVTMYFHTNLSNITLEPDISAYKYLDGTSAVAPDDVEKTMSNVIDELNKKRNKYSFLSKDIFKKRLYYWIDQKVLEIHRKTINKHGKESAANIAKAEVLPISDLLNAIKGDGFSDLQTKEEKASFMKAYYLKCFEDEVFNLIDLQANGSNDILNLDQIKAFEDALVNYPREDLWNLFIRLNPHSNVSDDENPIAWGGDNSTHLFEVINKVDEPLEDKIRWSKDGRFESPSTITGSGDNFRRRICYKIYKNKGNLNVLFDYKWLVADIDKTIISVTDVIPNIKNNIDNADKTKNNNSIFHPQNIGLLSIEDKNYEND
jgi:hypothetical protein